MSTFGQFCDELRCTIHEREQLAYRLAAYRMEATLRALLLVPVKVGWSEHNEEDES